MCNGVYKDSTNTGGAAMSSSKSNYDEPTEKNTKNPKQNKKSNKTTQTKKRAKPLPRQLVPFNRFIFAQITLRGAGINFGKFFQPRALGMVR